MHVQADYHRNGGHVNSDGIAFSPGAAAAEAKVVTWRTGEKTSGERAISTLAARNPAA